MRGYRKSTIRLDFHRVSSTGRVGERRYQLYMLRIDIHTRNRARRYESESENLNVTYEGCGGYGWFVPPASCVPERSTAGNKHAYPCRLNPWNWPVIYGLQKGFACPAGFMFSSAGPAISIGQVTYMCCMHVSKLQWTPIYWLSVEIEPSLRTRLQPSSCATWVKTLCMTNPIQSAPAQSIGYVGYLPELNQRIDFEGFQPCRADIQ